MRINRDYEKEVDLRDLWFHLVFRWRSILLAVLIGALAAGGFRFGYVLGVHARGGQTKEDAQYAKDLAKYETNLAAAESELETAAAQKKKSDDYRAGSVWLGLDAENELVRQKRYYIRPVGEEPTAESGDLADYIGSAYVNSLKYDLDWDEIQTEFGTYRKEFLDELVKISVDYNTNQLTLQVLGDDRETVDRQLAYMAEQLETVAWKNAHEVAPHELSVVKDSCYVRTDDELLTRQSEAEKEAAEAEKRLAAAESALLSQRNAKPAAPGKNVKKYAAVGAAIAGILLALWYVLRYLFDGKLKRAKELSDRFDLPVYAELPRRRTKRAGGKLDNLLARWENGNADREKALDALAILLSERFAGKTVLLAGTADEAALQSCRDALDRRLGGAVTVKTLPRFSDNPEAVRLAGNADAVLLTEEAYRSRTKEIARAAELLVIGEAPCVGCVTV